MLCCGEGKKSLRYSEKGEKVLSSFTVIHSLNNATTILPNRKLMKMQGNMLNLSYCIYFRKSTLVFLHL